MGSPDGGGRRLRASAVIPASLSFENLTRRFGDKEAVLDVSFTAANGEVICLLGASGCGKSTLLRLAAGIEVPSAGRILVDGKEVAGPERFVEPEHRGIGLVFQDYALFPHLDALENVMFGLGNLPRREALVIADAALRRVGLGDRMRAMPHELSGGEQQRVALARAVVPRPRVLLMDEPFSNLDRRMRDQVREDTVAILRETGATALIVTHDPEEAMRIADRIALMRKGRLVQIGRSQDIYRHPVDLEAARFFCDLNEIEGIVQRGAVDTPVGRFPAAGKEEGSRAIVAIRPQNIRLKAAGFCLPGRVIDHRFIGEVELVDLAVQGLERPLRVRAAETVGLRPGLDVGVEISADEVLVF
ncbi:MAG: ABC transporter ATP-binding protein [Beijerinckiaceae bacterium]|jgi:iron(III) transport system ATP-binding protein|nr:ABC transporter ATP-binding protein [Beijerinckiaceae bacterium]